MKNEITLKFTFSSFKDFYRLMNAIRLEFPGVNVQEITAAEPGGKNPEKVAVKERENLLEVVSTIQEKSKIGV